MSHQDFTVPELKEFLRVRNLPVTGNKAELTERLEKSDENIWNILAAEKAQRQEEQLTARREEPEVEVTSSRLVQQELELLKRERDLMRREIDLLRREQQVTTEHMRSDEANSATNIGIRALSDLLSDFNGYDNFETWEQQVNLLRASYKLNDSAVRVLISSKLKGKALSWFHSKPEHLTYDVSELLESMKSMFHHRPSKLLLRKEFESRQWKSGERFTEYYHDKIILGNQISIDDEEMVDYIIDGITDRQLRDQARILCFDQASDLLAAFEKITLDYRKPSDRERKVNSVNNSYKKHPAEGKKVVKCFNCQETGHISTKCPKPRRSYGSCFGCGSTSHQLKECPRRVSRERPEEPSPSTSTNLVQPALSAPYMVNIGYSVSDKNGSNCKYSLNAILDSGSPISLIKESFVPIEVRSPVCQDKIEFRGINGSPLEIIAIFYSKVDIEGIIVDIKFYVVPNHTMAFMALLGRDFSTQSSIKITLADRVIISKNSDYLEDICLANNSDTAISEIMNIEIDDAYNNCERENLQINLNIGNQEVEKIKEMYSDYARVRDAKTCQTDFEMKISLKNDQVISLRPRRLSYSDKEKLQLILNDLLNRGIIRPSESPYASPIVLVRKKNGETRLCIDYRELNKITVKDNFPSPLIDDNIDLLKNKMYFTSLDLKDGYFNVKMAEDSIKYTSFVTPLGQFEFLYCPFGLTNAPKVFGRFVQKIFCELIKKRGYVTIFRRFFNCNNNFR